MAAPAALIPEEVLIGTADGPGLWLAPIGTAAPTDIDTAFVAPWLSLGYASDDGVTLSGDQSTEAFTPWQSRSAIRSIITEKSKTIQFIMWQLNVTTLGLYFDTVVAPPAVAGDPIAFDVRSDTGGIQYAIGLDVIDNTGKFRVIFPRATLDSNGDMTISKSSIVPLDVTLTALDDNGVLMKVQIDTPAVGTLIIPTIAPPAANTPAPSSS